VDESGAAKIAASVHPIEINWAMPTMSMPISMNEFNAQAKQKLEGVTIRFSVDPTGKVFDVPPSPPELDQASTAVLEGLIEGLTSAFFVVPDKRLTLGEGWENEDTRGREGKLGKYVVESTHGVLAGLYEHRESKQRLAKLTIDRDRTETTTTKDSSSETRVRETTNVLFDVDADYMTSIESTMTRTQGPNTTKVRFTADWTRSIAGNSQALPPADEKAQEQNTQNIADPCHDDYVGPNECGDPCSVNYMGEEACKEGSEDPPAAEGAGGDAAGEAPATDAD
ncbi:MAG: hypothetical protein KC457_25195, partial [Myxococcales bacterium]|nr:hypothetical protein [Myxococcales bacterium]